MGTISTHQSLRQRKGHGKYFFNILYNKERTLEERREERGERGERRTMHERERERASEEGRGQASAHYALGD